MSSSPVGVLVGEVIVAALAVVLVVGLIALRVCDRSAPPQTEQAPALKLTRQRRVQLQWLLVFSGAAVSLVLLLRPITSGFGWTAYIFAVTPGVMVLGQVVDIRRRQRLLTIDAGPLPEEVLKLAADGDRSGAIRLLVKLRYSNLAPAENAVVHVMTTRGAGPDARRSDVDGGRIPTPHRGE